MASASPAVACIHGRHSRRKSDCRVGVAVAASRTRAGSGRQPATSTAGPRQPDVEAMNGLPQQTKRAARGFRTVANFVAIVYPRMAKLKELPAKSAARRRATGFRRYSAACRLKSNSTRAERNKTITILRCVVHLRVPIAQRVEQEVRCRQRFGEVIALRDVTSPLADQRQRMLGLHAFRHHLVVKLLGQCDQRAHDALVARVAVHIADQRLVDFDHGGRYLL